MAENIRRRRKSLNNEENSGHGKPESKAQVATPVKSDARIPNSPAAVGGSVKSSCETKGARHASAKKCSSVRKKKKVFAQLRNSRYPLRSSIGGGRVLRSMSNGSSKATPDSSTNPLNILKEKRKRRKKLKRTPEDEFTRARKQVRYMLTRMNYEQSLIDAYSGEGWRGQSSEKIKPEKELQRAQSEIMRCKLKIRDVFQYLDSLLSEGRLDNSLFDSEGEIDSEDIFCAKCRAKELSADNDIILCDGVCNRGFHQKCLNPPLLNENIPPGDEGWLCPGCDCKVDCLQLLNEFQGTDLSSMDNWEKIFPEAAAVEPGDRQYDGLPSDDSEDEDYDPESQKVSGEAVKESSSSEDSDSTSSSADTESSDHTQHYENFGFPSDDSEDNDYDPDNPDLDENLQEDGSDSDESDFTSDSMVARASFNDPSKVDEASKSPSTSIALSAKRKAKSKPSIKSELNSLMEPDIDHVVSSSGKRQSERLDYKKLYDEAYGNSSSDSGDDEDWTDMSTPKKMKNGVIEDKGDALSIKKLEGARRTRRRPHGGGTVQNPKLDESQVLSEMADSEIYSSKPQGKLSENSFHRRTHRKLSPEIMNHKQDTDFVKPDSNGNKADTSAQRSFRRETSQKLQEFFRENQYPSRDKKESYAQELGITLAQVNKWFGNARHSFRAKEAARTGQAGVDSPGNADLTSKSNQQNKKSMGMCSKKPASNEVKGKPVSAGNIKVGDSECGITVERRVASVGVMDREKLVLRELRKRRGK